jgi:hypothetical protein
MKKIILFLLLLAVTLKASAGLTPEQMDEIEAQAPKVETPKVEAPKVEAPKVEAPKVEAPKAPTVVEMRLDALERKVEIHDLQIKAAEHRIEVVEDTTRLINGGLTSMMVGQWWRAVSAPFKKAKPESVKEDKK